MTPEEQLKDIVDRKNKEEIDQAARDARVEANKAADNAPVDPMESEEVQIAAGYYAQLCRTIKGYSGNMNAGGLKRVIVAFAEFPYGENYPKFRSKAEQELFTFLLTIQSAKAKIAAAIQPELGKLEEKAIDGIVEETMATIKGEGNGNKVD